MNSQRLTRRGLAISAEACWIHSSCWCRSFMLARSLTSCNRLICPYVICGKSEQQLIDCHDPLVMRKRRSVAESQALLENEIREAVVMKRHGFGRVKCFETTAKFSICREGVIGLPCTPVGRMHVRTVLSTPALRHRMMACDWSGTGFGSDAVPVQDACRDASTS